jgi:6-phosphofructokinase 2
LYEPGGGGVNVARAIKKSGGQAVAIYLSGGCSGKLFRELLVKESVETIEVAAQESIRENLIVFETSTSQQYRFGMPGPFIQETEWKACLAAIEKIQRAEYIVASGSLSPGIPTDIFARIAVICRRKKIKLIVDTSGEALKQAVAEGVFLIKPNLGELSMLVGKEELNLERVDEAAKEVINNSKCEVIVVSMGPAGAMLVTKEQTMHVMPPAVKRKSTVGAGDSMVAGIVLSLSKGKNLMDAVQYGVACGTAATMNPGTELCRKEDAEHLYKLIQTKVTVPY